MTGICFSLSCIMHFKIDQNRAECLTPFGNETIWFRNDDKITPSTVWYGVQGSSKLSAKQLAMREFCRYWNAPSCWHIRNQSCKCPRDILNLPLPAGRIYDRKSLFGQCYLFLSETRTPHTGMNVWEIHSSQIDESCLAFAPTSEKTYRFKSRCVLVQEAKTHEQELCKILTVFDH